MKRLLCFLFALLLFHSDSGKTPLRFYTVIIFQDGRCYQEFMTHSSLNIVLSDFVSDSSIESVFFTRDIPDVHKSDNDR